VAETVDETAHQLVAVAAALASDDGEVGNLEAGPDVAPVEGPPPPLPLAAAVRLVRGDFVVVAPG
jgi:hypothetical protein